MATKGMLAMIEAILHKARFKSPAEVAWEKARDELRRNIATFDEVTRRLADATPQPGRLTSEMMDALRRDLCGHD